MARGVMGASQQAHKLRLDQVAALLHPGLVICGGKRRDYAIAFFWAIPPRALACNVRGTFFAPALARVRQSSISCRLTSTNSLHPGV